MQKKSEAQATTKKITDSKVFWAVLSLFLSVFIWIYYSANYATEMTTTFYGVEVVYTGRDAMRDSLNLIVSHEETTSVNVTLTGSRRDISRMSREDIKAVVNLSSVTSAGYRTMGYTLSYPNSVNSAAITVKSQSPQTVGLQISKLATKVVDIKGRFDGTVLDGYALDPESMAFDPASVTLIGPEEELEQVSCAAVVIDRDNVSATFSTTANFNLVDADGTALVFDDVTMDADTVGVTVPVNLTKEVAIDVYLIDGGGASAGNIVKKIEPSTITLAGDAATLEAINTIYIASIDLSDYSTFTPTEYPIVLPNDTESLSDATTATVELSFTGLESGYYTITNLEYINLAEGYTAEFMGNTLVANIRAPEGVLSQIEANNIRAVADLTDITTTSRAPVTVYVDGFSDAGAVGDYTMYVRVKPEE